VRERPGPRGPLAAHLVRRVAELSRRLGTGSGSVVGGRVGLLIDPGLLRRLGAGRTIALVSATNGKTTTTAMLAVALGALGEVAHSEEGANMTAGLVSALAESPHARYAVLEVDEGYVPEAIASLDPVCVVLLNLSRDQLDRVGEVRMVASRWRDALSDGRALVFANADDPIVCFAAADAGDVRYVGVGGLWHEDAYHCPVCDQRITFVTDGRGWSCTCGFARPETIAELEGTTLHIGGDDLALPESLPGRFNAANAAIAICAAQALGVAPADAVARISALGDVGGRFQTETVEGTTTRLLLAKNPAGWTEMLDLVSALPPGPVVVGINARVQDGQDPSWLWDVPFERLVERFVIATGERRRDLAVRLRHAGVKHAVVADPLAAIGAASATPAPSQVEFIGNYSAFQDARRDLGLPDASSRVAGGTQAQIARIPAVKAKRLSRRKPLRIVLVFPDLLGTYGDSGNARVLVNRARWRGIAAELVIATSDEPLPEGADCYVLGGAEDGPQIRAAEILRGGILAAAVEAGAVVLGVCAGFQLLGQTFPAADGYFNGVGLLDVETVRVTRRRAVGEVRVEAAGTLSALGTLTGFENHAGRTRLAPSAVALGQVKAGVGNDESSRADGAVAGRVLGTYLHGPVLARNPALADYLLSLTTTTRLSPLDDAEERELRAERLARTHTRGRPRPRLH
jgi:lipid II isoglutaminyl synthase (glutamine-hydrolysing)